MKIMIEKERLLATLSLVKQNPSINIELLLQTMGVDEVVNNEPKENDYKKDNWEDGETRLLRKLLDEYKEVKNVPAEKILELSRLLDRTTGAITARLYGIKKGEV